MAAVISGMFTVFVKSENGEGLGGFAPDGGTPSSNKATDVRMGNGSIVDLAPGEDVSFANPGRPSTSFDPFVQAILRQVGVALGLPFEVLIKHFTASYSAARAALLQAWQFFNSRRDFLASTFCTPIYEAWLEEAIALGRIQAPGFFDDPAIRRAYLQADWIGDAPSSIDPEKEVNAAKTRIEIGVSDLAHETLALTGRVWDDVNRQQEKERKARIASGLEVAAIPTQPGGTPTIGQEKQQQAGTGQPAPAPAQNKGSDLENGGQGNAGN
jgi:lambda family phage portal protein